MASQAERERAPGTARRSMLAAVSVALVGLSVTLIPASQAAFPGLNGKIAFETYRDGNAEIYTMAPDGTALVNLTNAPAADRAPAWSPDGSQIVFISSSDGTETNFEIMKMNADGSGLVQLTTNSAVDADPGWFPDGRIAFDSARDCNREIYVMNGDGSNQTRLTTDCAFHSDATVSPDGSKIAFRRGNDLWIMDANGSNQTALATAGNLDFTPSWSPDGSKIAFASDRDGDLEIFVMNADGSNQTQLTTNTAADLLPAWSPDGSKIAFTSDRDGNAEIYVMNAEGSNQTRVTNDSAVDNAPDWQPAFYEFSGFFQPVDNPGSGPTPVFNVAKAGSGIPVKFSLGGNQGLSIFASGYPKSQQIACDASATFDGIEQTVTAGSSSLSYDATTDKYTYVWKTDKLWANTCRKLTVRLNDSTDHVAYFMFTK
jgi:Tol biopolymer transport system component